MYLFIYCLYRPSCFFFIFSFSYFSTILNFSLATSFCNKLHFKSVLKYAKKKSPDSVSFNLQWPYFSNIIYVYLKM